MGVEITQLNLSAFLSKCECQCSHCLLEGQESQCRMEQVDKLGSLAFHLQHVIEGRFPVYINPYRSLEYRELPQVIAWNRQLGNSHVHVNVNGTRMRNGTELLEWVRWLRDVCQIDTAEVSWFGTEDFMDMFVHCKGYFEYLTRLTRVMRENRIELEHKVFVMNHNIKQLPALYQHLECLGGRISPAFLDYRGYGKNLIQEYMDENQVLHLPGWIRESYLLKSGRYAPERMWIRQIQKEGTPVPSKATLFLVVDQQRLDAYKGLTYDNLMEIVFEKQRKLDSCLPCVEELAALYGNLEGSKYYEYRSLVLKWQEQYILEYEPGKKDLLFSDLKTGVLWR